MTTYPRAVAELLVFLAIGSKVSRYCECDKSIIVNFT